MKHGNKVLFEQEDSIDEAPMELINLNGKILIE
jgi:hypothetical protein